MVLGQLILMSWDLCTWFWPLEWSTALEGKNFIELVRGYVTSQGSCSL